MLHEGLEPRTLGILDPCSTKLSYQSWTVPTLGIEPRTCTNSYRCSSNWATWAHTEQVPITVAKRDANGSGYKIIQRCPCAQRWLYQYQWCKSLLFCFPYPKLCKNYVIPTTTIRYVKAGYCSPRSKRSKRFVKSIWHTWIAVRPYLKPQQVPKVNTLWPIEQYRYVRVVGKTRSFRLSSGG